MAPSSPSRRVSGPCASALAATSDRHLDEGNAIQDAWWICEEYLSIDWVVLVCYSVCVLFGHYHRRRSDPHGIRGCRAKTYPSSPPSGDCGSICPGIIPCVPRRPFRVWINGRQACRRRSGPVGTTETRPHRRHPVQAGTRDPAELPPRRLPEIRGVAQATACQAKPETAADATSQSPRKKTRRSSSTEVRGETRNGGSRA